MDTLIKDRTRTVGSLQERLTVEAPSTPDGILEIDLQYTDPQKSADSDPIARSFVVLPWEVAKEVATAVQEREMQFSGH